MSNEVLEPITEEDFIDLEVFVGFDGAIERLGRLATGWGAICWNAYEGCDGAKDEQIFHEGSTRFGPCADSPSDCIQITRINLNYFD
ncbi:MAG: hypothetical protein PVJ67_02175 [Candidatus Pacearchaeota archaeon]|jgi:hypothetical protein